MKNITFANFTHTSNLTSFLTKFVNILCFIAKFAVKMLFCLPTQDNYTKSSDIFDIFLCRFIQKVNLMNLFFCFRYGIFYFQGFLKVFIKASIFQDRNNRNKNAAFIKKKIIFTKKKVFYCNKFFFKFKTRTLKQIRARNKKKKNIEIGELSVLFL